MRRSKPIFALFADRATGAAAHVLMPAEGLGHDSGASRCAAHGLSGEPERPLSPIIMTSIIRMLVAASGRYYCAARENTQEGKLAVARQIFR